MGSWMRACRWTPTRRFAGHATGCPTDIHPWDGSGGGGLMGTHTRKRVAAVLEQDAPPTRDCRARPLAIRPPLKADVTRGIAWSAWTSRVASDISTGVPMGAIWYSGVTPHEEVSIARTVRVQRCPAAPTGRPRQAAVCWDCAGHAFPKRSDHNAGRRPAQR